MADVRRALVVLVVGAIAALAAAGVAGGDRSAGRVGVPGGLGVRVPVGWHVVRGWLSDVVDPAPRLAVASFSARLSRRTCTCGLPNVVNFPRMGAFVFVWEYLHPSRRQLASVPGRPDRFQLAPSDGVRHTCEGPSDTFGFTDAGRVFQVEVYLGPRVGPALRGRLATMLASLRVGPARDETTSEVSSGSTARKLRSSGARRFGP
jgi:hypothetical protein